MRRDVVEISARLMVHELKNLEIFNIKSSVAIH
jgi:hypothetical protein